MNKVTSQVFATQQRTMVNPNGLIPMLIPQQCVVVRASRTG
jgi:hypothetical protein